MKSLYSLIFAALLMGLVAGCSSTPKAPQSDQDQSATEDANGTAGNGLQADESGTALNRMGGGSDDLDHQDMNSRGDWDRVETERRVYFALNSAILNHEATELLAKNVDWLSSQRKDIIIEGHCDERGTREYNLALGQQRAEAVVRFLTARGVDPDMIQAISYGKERPLIRGHNSSSWAKNRRAEITIR
jgi:peptidoglycan-associated lipoprotein